ncbi:MAG: hypothetical protein AABX70_01275 [Nanoarchaeota archaeon]
MPTPFHHTSLELTAEHCLVYTAISKHYFFCRMFISKYVLEQHKIPLNPYMILDYFLLDTVNQDLIREANNNLVKRSDELWVFGPVSDGVLAEIKIAKQAKKPIRYFKIKKYNDMIPLTQKEIEMEEDVKEYRNEL